MSSRSQQESSHVPTRPTSGVGVLRVVLKVLLFLVIAEAITAITKVLYLEGCRVRVQVGSNARK